MIWISPHPPLHLLRSRSPFSGLQPARPHPAQELCSRVTGVCLVPQEAWPSRGLSAPPPLPPGQRMHSQGDTGVAGAGDSRSVFRWHYLGGGGCSQHSSLGSCFLIRSQPAEGTEGWAGLGVGLLPAHLPLSPRTQPHVWSLWLGEPSTALGLCPSLSQQVCLSLHRPQELGFLLILPCPQTVQPSSPGPCPAPCAALPTLRSQRSLQS